MATNFIIYDIGFLVIFTIFLFTFLYLRRENLKKEGILLLYRTSWGIKLINKVGKKYSNTLKFLSYISIVTGYALMGVMFYMLGKIVYIYITLPSVVQAIKVPPVIPLIPYIDKVVPNLGLPSFYFTYFIVIIAIIAISHEFAHGIFMRKYDIKINFTGFGFFPWFFPIFPAAFVEQDDKSMNKSGKFEQMVVLSAGTFANLLTAILFFGILWIFFTLAFTASGVEFNNYPQTIVEVSAITMINGIQINNPDYDKVLSLMDEEGLNKIKTDNNYVITKGDLEARSNNKEIIPVYYDAPAINNNLERKILKINDVEIQSIDSLRSELSKYSPGDKITLTVLGIDDGPYNRDIVLGENPKENSLPWLGIEFAEQRRSSVMGKIYSMLNFKEDHVYYHPNFNISLFIYYLLWWLVLISISVALVNMLPVGIFDGGRFFYLTVLGITKNKKIAEQSFAFVTYFFIFILFVLMFFWAISFF